MGPCSGRVCGGGAGSTASCPAGRRSFCARAAGLDLLPPGRRGRRAQQDGPRRPSGGPWAGPGTQPSSSALCGSSRGCADLGHVGVRASCASDKGEETQGPPGGNRPGLGGDWAGGGAVSGSRATQQSPSPHCTAATAPCSRCPTLSPLPTRASSDPEVTRVPVAGACPRLARGHCPYKGWGCPAIHLSGCGSWCWGCLVSPAVLVQVDKYAAQRHPCGVRQHAALPLLTQGSVLLPCRSWRLCHPWVPGSIPRREG